MGKYEWLFYVALAGLSWGTYVPIIFFGGSELGGKASSRMTAILCVGGAYFVIGVLFPLLMFATGWGGIKWGDVNLTKTGLVFSSLAGVAGAVGAICVIFATQSAVAAGKDLTPPNPAAFKVYIAPLIFGLAPIINVLVGTIWHPEHGWSNFGIEKVPHWSLWVGIVLVGLGAALVLYSKELSEAPAHKPAEPKQSATLDGVAGPTAAITTEPKP
jgi:hypothetical protein